MSNEVLIEVPQPIELLVVQTDPALAASVQLALEGLVAVNAQLSQTVTQAQLNTLTAVVNDLADQVAAIQTAMQGSG